MRMMQRFFWVFLGLLSLTSCTTFDTEDVARNQTLSWETRSHQLSTIQAWDINGVIAIRTRHEANSALLRWQQHNHHFTLFFFGPLGIQTYKLSGEPGKVELDTPDGHAFYATSPEILLATQTGWRLPVSNLYYWIRGLPVPQLAALEHFDAYHHLTELVQQGWHIHFLRYSATERGDLPSKIFLNSPELNVKIIISQWQLSH